MPVTTSVGTDIPTYRGRRQTTCPPSSSSTPLEESSTALFQKERFTGIPLPFSFLPSFTHQMVLRWTIDWWPIARCPRNPVLPPETVQVCRHARSPLSLSFFDWVHEGGGEASWPFDVS